MIMIGLISILVIRVFMMMAMTNGHHEEFLRIDEILVIMMMAMMVLMVMACIKVIMLMEVMPAMTMIGMIIVMMFMMVIRLMMLVVVIAMMITLRTSQELTTSRSYAAPRRPCSHLLARTGSVFLCSSNLYPFCDIFFVNTSPCSYRICVSPPHCYPFSISFVKHTFAVVYVFSQPAF